jgi:hypothetical protein
LTYQSVIPIFSSIYSTVLSTKVKCAKRPTEGRL